MGFKNDYSQANAGSSLKPEGYYECIIMAVEERATKNGKMGLNFTLLIRNDVAGQRYGNARLFHTIWKKKDPTQLDMQVNGYNFGQLMALGKAACLPDGKDYEGLKQYCEDLLNKCVRVKLEHESNPDYKNGEPQERLREFSPTNYPECKHIFKQAANTNGFASSNPGVVNSPAQSTYTPAYVTDDGVPF